MVTLHNGNTNNRLCRRGTARRLASFEHVVKLILGSDGSQQQFA